MLRHVGVFADPAALVDASTADDAAVYRLAEDRAIVATADFFTPIVDDPFDFGRIAAANALSDIYAMGARPLFALNLVAFPRKHLETELLGEILRGGVAIAREAGIPILGGHSIDDVEPKYGLCAIGEVHPDRIVRNVGALPGDALVLTKPVGTGIISTALKQDAAPRAAIVAATHSMATLNAGAARALVDVGVHAATDVTGFGLLGHLLEMMRGSGTGARISAAAVPLLPHAFELAATYVAGGTSRNMKDVGESVEWDAAVSQVQRVVLCDAQTSGGLLIAVSADRVSQLLHRLTEEKTLAAAHIGDVTERAGVLQVLP